MASKKKPLAKARTEKQFRATSIKIFGEPVVKAVDDITTMFEDKEDYSPVEKSTIAWLLKDLINAETVVLRNNLQEAVKEIREHQAEYHHRTCPTKIKFWDDLSRG